MEIKKENVYIGAAFMVGAILGKAGLIIAVLAIVGYLFFRKDGEIENSKNKEVKGDKAKEVEKVKKKWNNKYYNQLIRDAETEE